MVPRGRSSGAAVFFEIAPAKVRQPLGWRGSAISLLARADLDVGAGRVLDRLELAVPGLARGQLLAGMPAPFRPRL